MWGPRGTKPLGRDVVTFETLVVIEGEDERVKPGMTANVEIEVARKSEALTVPVQSVVYRRRRDLPAELLKEHDARRTDAEADAQQSVAEYIRLLFCIEEGKAHMRLVETGINDATSVEITEGVAAGEVVVTGPYRSLDQLKDGSSVKVAEKPEEEAEESGEEKTEDTATSQPTTAPSEESSE